MAIKARRTGSVVGLNPDKGIRLSNIYVGAKEGFFVYVSYYISCFVQQTQIEEAQLTKAYMSNARIIQNDSYSFP